MLDFSGLQKSLSFIFTDTLQIREAERKTFNSNTGRHEFLPGNVVYEGQGAIVPASQPGSVELASKIPDADSSVYKVILPMNSPAVEAGMTVAVVKSGWAAPFPEMASKVFIITARPAASSFAVFKIAHAEEKTNTTKRKVRHER